MRSPCFDSIAFAPRSNPSVSTSSPASAAPTITPPLLRKRGRLFAPAIVLTSHQLAGRGRGSNSWWSGAAASPSRSSCPFRIIVCRIRFPLIAGLCGAKCDRAPQRHRRHSTEMAQRSAASREEARGLALRAIGSDRSDRPGIECERGSGAMYREHCAIA